MLLGPELGQVYVCPSRCLPMAVCPIHPSIPPCFSEPVRRAAWGGHRRPRVAGKPGLLTPDPRGGLERSPVSQALSEVTGWQAGSCMGGWWQVPQRGPSCRVVVCSSRTHFIDGETEGQSVAPFFPKGLEWDPAPSSK